MKNILLPFCLLVSFLSFSQVTYFDDFESYNLADPIAQTSSHWNSWAELTTPGTLPPFADDIMISNTMASSGDYSSTLGRKSAHRSRRWRRLLHFRCTPANAFCHRTSGRHRSFTTTHCDSGSLSPTEGLQPDWPSHR